MSRQKPLHAARRVVAGTERSHEPGTTLDCLLCAPGADWVAIDIKTGALVRSAQGAGETPGVLDGEPGSAVCLHLAPSEEPWDPSRPEAVALSDATRGRAPTTRARRRLLSAAARSDDAGGVLGSIGQSLPFVELTGTRPSVVLVRPSAGRVRLVGDDETAAHFLLGERLYSFPLGEGALSWIRSGALSTVSGTGRRGAEKRGPGIEPTDPVVVVVGFDRPSRGQVRKIVLGMVPVT